MFEKLPDQIDDTDLIHATCLRTTSKKTIIILRVQDGEHEEYNVKFSIDTWNTIKNKVFRSIAACNAHFAKHKVWSQEETAQITEMLEAGLSNQTICANTGLTENALASKKYRLGFKFKNGKWQR